MHFSAHIQSQAVMTRQLHRLDFAVQFLGQFGDIGGAIGGQAEIMAQVGRLRPCHARLHICRHRAIGLQLRDDHTLRLGFRQTRQVNPFARSVFAHDTRAVDQQAVGQDIKPPVLNRTVKEGIGVAQLEGHDKGVELLGTGSCHRQEPPVA